MQNQAISAIQRRQARTYPTAQAKVSHTEGLNDLWRCITDRIDEIKALSDEYVIGINDGSTNYGSIEKSALSYDGHNAWLQLNHNTKLTIFSKEDYDLKLQRILHGVVSYSQSEIAHLFTFSKVASPETVFENWNNYD